jgi:hypothetical protein
MNTESQKTTDLSQVKQLVFSEWSLFGSKGFKAEDTQTGIECLLTPKNNRWVAELRYQGSRVAKLEEKLPEKSKVLEVPQSFSKYADSVKIAHAVKEARDEGKIGISMDGYIYRYTTGGNLYRLFTGVSEKGTKLLPKSQFLTIYARLNKTAVATLVVNLELRTANTADRGFTEPSMTMEEIDKYLALNPDLIQ